MKNPSGLTRYLHLSLLAMLGLFAVTTASADDSKLRPFVLAAISNQDMATALAETRSKLTGAGFEIVGEVQPYPGSHVLVISNAKLRQHATQSEFGAYGAALRVTITDSKAGQQIAFTNPVYMAQVYRMKEDLTDTYQQLVSALGKQQDYGSDKGLSRKELRDYHYTFMMPYFDDPLDLARYPDQATALSKVEAALIANKAGVKKVYRIDLPGKEETVIGVQLSGKNADDCSADTYIMSRIDFKDTKSAGHLPYEIVISKGRVYALPAEFRIAINFPDLSMMGSNSFASIMCAPDAIMTALTRATGGKLASEY